jgi:hypothetical protein
MITMIPEIKILHAACELPDDWDRSAAEYFQTREFLQHTEKYNPCKQRYYLLSINGIFKTGVVVYTLRLDLLTYLSIPSPVSMTIAGIPCSVSSGGIVGNRDYARQIIGTIKTMEKGLFLVLNMEPCLNVEKMTHGKTLPTITIFNHFYSWEHYLSSLRAPYRRRIRQISVPFMGVSVKKMMCAGFDEEMYGQYRNVLKRSNGKLETLTMGFFRNLPLCFDLTAFYKDGKLCGWYITTTYGDRFYFFLGGIDYQTNKQYHTYFNVLLAVLKDGIESKAQVIDLGQTAEIPKVRLGGIPVEKSMLAYHSNRIIRLLLDAGKSLLEYSVKVKETHVFKITE